MDICQSVMASFFVRAANGQYELDRPENLLRLLVAMARTKLAFEVRKQRAQRRDHRRIGADGQEILDGIAGGSSPSQLAAGRDLLQQVRLRLTEEERQLADRRSQGWQWTEIAAQLGGTPEGRRRQLARALDRVAQDLGLDELTHE